MSRRTDTRLKRWARGSVSWLLVATLVTATVTGGVVANTGTGGATDDRSAASGSAFVVALEDDGDATISVEITFDLTDDADRAAFDALRENETKQENLETRTERRFRTVAASAANETGREMAIEAVRVSFEIVDGEDRGVATVSVDWRGFAASEGDELRVTEPFASGYATDRPLVLELPDGYAIADAQPAPSDRADGRIVWNANTSLDGYEVIVAPDDGRSDGDSQPGPGLVGTVVAIAGAVWLHRRR